MRAAVCVGSGPSLTASDCAQVGQSGLFTIAVNNAWKAARFCDVIYAGDKLWWSEYGASVDIPAERWSRSREAGTKYHRAPTGHCSGAGAIQWAFDNGFNRVILLGYDCSLADGVHYDGEHKHLNNPGAGKIDEWLLQFNMLALSSKFSGMDIINASRKSAIQCFRTMTLEDALCLSKGC